MSKEIRVLFFATLKKMAGRAEVKLQVPEDTKVQDIRALLQAEMPELEQGLKSAIFSVNHEFAFPGDPIPPGAEVAVFPPVSGGSGEPINPPTIYIITEEALDLNDLLRRITLPSSGAACIFTGMVRGVTHRGEAHETSYLVYEAYTRMAENKMRQVAAEIRERWSSVEGIALVQRIGRLEPGTPTVMIACTAAHRDTGVFDAARYGIDRLKEIVPVWKKEVSPEGEEWVEGGYTPGVEDRA